MEFASIVPDTTRNNLVLQSVIREADADTLVTALIGLEPAVRNAFLRNLSKRTRAAIESEVRLREGRTSRSRIDASQARVGQLLRTFDEQTPGEIPSRPRRAPPELQVDSQEQIVDTFVSLARYAQENGLLSLEELEPAVSNPFMRKGLGFVVDGWDAVDWRTVMEKHREAQLHALETRLSMILDGLESLQAGDSPRVVEERLRAYLDQS